MQDIGYEAPFQAEEAKNLKVSQHKFTYEKRHPVYNELFVTKSTLASFKSSKEVLDLTRNIEAFPPDLLRSYTRGFTSYRLALEDQYIYPNDSRIDNYCHLDYTNINSKLSQSNESRKTNEMSHDFEHTTVSSSRDYKEESSEMYRLKYEAQETNIIDLTKKGCFSERCGFTKNETSTLTNDCAQLLQMMRVYFDAPLSLLNVFQSTDCYPDLIVPLFWKSSHAQRHNKFKSPVGNRQFLQAYDKQLSKKGNSAADGSKSMCASRNFNVKSKHICGSCGKTFKRPSSLRIHKNTHTGTKPYTCPLEDCSRKFNVLSNMKRHYKLHFR